MIREVIESVTDTLDTNQWRVMWIDDNGKTQVKSFYYKHHARDFKNGLPYMNKRMERA